MPNVVLSPTGTTLNKQFEFEKKSKPLLFYFKSWENFGTHLVVSRLMRMILFGLWGSNGSQIRTDFSLPQISHASTKREMLSAIDKLFDLLGLIGPILMVAKILMQSLWEIKTGWDDPFPDSV